MPFNALPPIPPLRPDPQQEPIGLSLEHFKTSADENPKSEKYFYAGSSFYFPVSIAEMVAEFRNELYERSKNSPGITQAALDMLAKTFLEGLMADTGKPK